MSSVSWARAPTRRASAEMASLLRPGGVVVGAVGLDGSHPAGDQGEDEEDDGASEHDPEPTDQASLGTGTLRRALLLGVGGGAAASRNSRSIAVRVVSVRDCQSSARVSRTPR